MSFDWYIESGLDSGEYLSMDIYSAGGWHDDVAILRGNVDQENTWHSETISLDESQLTNDFKIRFRSKASWSNEDANVDDVQLVATSLAGPPNQLPIADAGGPYSGVEGSGVAFDGSASWDLDGTVVSYAWDFGDGNVVVGPTPNHTHADDGSYIVTLAVPDDAGGIAVDTNTVTVANVGPMADAGGPYSGNEGSNIMLNASASSDPGFDIASFDWDFDADGQYDDASGVSVAFNPGNEGEYTIGLRVTDDDGATSFDTATVSVSNVAPVADAGGPYAGEAGITVTLAGSAIDPGMDALTYEWDFEFDGNFAADISGVDLTSPSHVYAMGGTYAVALRVSDGTEMSVLATSAVNISERPVAQANGPYTADEGMAIVFDASGSDDADGTIVTYAWDFRAAISMCQREVVSR